MCFFFLLHSLIPLPSPLLRLHSHRANRALDMSMACGKGKAVCGAEPSLSAPPKEENVVKPGGSEHATTSAKVERERQDGIKDHEAKRHK